MKLHVEESEALANRYQVRFTPAIFVLRPDGEPIQGSSGYLPPDEYAAFISVGRAKALLDAARFGDAIAALKEVADAWPGTDSAPEALYWWGVADYKKTQGFDGLKEVWKRLADRYPESVWKRKVSFAVEEAARAGEARERAPREPGKRV